MTNEREAEFVFVDTNVMAYFAGSSLWSAGYAALLDGRRIALSFQVRAELGGYPESAGWGGRRQEALALLIEDCLQVPHSEASNTWYTRVTDMRRRLSNGAQDADAWIIAQALEHDAPLMTHDAQAAELAAAMGVEVLTLLTTQGS